MRLHRVPKQHFSRSKVKILNLGTDTAANDHKRTIVKLNEEPPRRHLRSLECFVNSLLQINNEGEHIWKRQNDPRGVPLAS